MKQAQLKMSVQVHSIKLQVKFPCSIAAALRIDTEELPYSQEVPLRMGEALFDQSVSHQFTLMYDSSRKAFQEKKIAVLLFLKSSSGRIPAGSVSLPINQIVKGLSRQAIGVEKCPDKRAVVELSISCDILNELDLYSGQENAVKYSPRSSEVNKRMTFGGNLSSRPMKGSMMEKSAYRKKNNDKDDTTPKTAKELESEGNEIVRNENQKSTSGFRGQFDSQSHQSPHHYTEYSVRSKTNHLERQLKTYQSKCQQQNMEIKNITAKKDILERSLKETEGQLKAFKQKYEDLKIQYDNFLKKNEYKDNSLKEEIRNISQKLAASEAEKQRMIFERNDLMDDFEEREKGLRLGLKQKENSVNSQKNRLAKTVQRLTNQLNQLKTQQSDSSFKQQQLIKELTQQRKNLDNVSQKNSELSQDIVLLKTEIQQKKSQIIQLQEALGANVELEQEKKKFRKKLGDLELEITNQLKANAISEANAQKYQRRCEELEQTLKEKMNILKNLQRQTENLNNQSNILKNTIQDQELKLQQFTSSKQRENQKLEGTIKDLTEAQNRLKEEIKAHLSQLKYKDNVISGLKEQMENDHGEISSIGKKNSELQIQLLEQRNNLSKLQYDLEELTVAKEQLETDKTELEVQLDSYIHELQKVEKDRKAQKIAREDEKRQLQSKIKSLEYSIQNSTEESSFQMKELQRKVMDLTSQSTSKSQEIEILHGQISILDEQKTHTLKQNEELLYNLNLKQKQSIFLNESLQKAHQNINTSIAQNKKLQLEIESYKKNIQDLNQELQQLHEELNNATSSGSNTRQELNDYKTKNMEMISLFLSGIKGGIIESTPEHQESAIVEMMQSAIDRNNEFVVQTDANFKQLQNQQEQLKADCQALREELANMQELQEGTSVKLQETSDQLTAELNKNVNLEEKVNNLENSLNKQQQSTSAEGTKLRNEIATLKETIGGLQEKYKERSNKCNQLDRNLTIISKQLKELESKSENELEKKRKQIQAKATTILRYGEIEKQLRAGLAEANKQINSLKDVNENIRKRNQKGTVRQNQLENELNTLKDRYSALTKKESQLQKQHNLVSNQLNGLKAKHNKLQGEDRKLKAQLQAARNTIKMKQDLLGKSQNQVKALENQKRILEKQCNENNREIQKLNKVSTDLGGIKTQLEDKLTKLGTMMEKQEQTHSLESQYLKPIRENLSFLKGYMAEYSRVGDQFEANKNKLLKMAGNRVEQYTERNVADKLREISLVFQKLKAYLLTSAGLNEKQKENVTQEVKKVQSTLDRSLRGDR